VKNVTLEDDDDLRSDYINAVVLAGILRSSLLESHKGGWHIWSPGEGSF